MATLLVTFDWRTFFLESPRYHRISSQHKFSFDDSEWTGVDCIRTVELTRGYDEAVRVLYWGATRWKWCQKRLYLLWRVQISQRQIPAKVRSVCGFPLFSALSLAQWVAIGSFSFTCTWRKKPDLNANPLMWLTCDPEKHEQVYVSLRHLHVRRNFHFTIQ